MVQKRSKMAKFFIYLILVCMIFASFAIYIVMYAWISNTLEEECPEWYVMNEKTWECEEVVDDVETSDDVEFNDNESCSQAWWTWYEANNLCILPDAQ